MRGALVCLADCFLHSAHVVGAISYVRQERLPLTLLQFHIRVWSNYCCWPLRLLCSNKSLGIWKEDWGFHQWNGRDLKGRKLVVGFCLLPTLDGSQEKGSKTERCWEFFWLLTRKTWGNFGAAVSLLCSSCCKRTFG